MVPLESCKQLCKHDHLTHTHTWGPGMPVGTRHRVAGHFPLSLRLFSGNYNKTRCCCIRGYWRQYLSQGQPQCPPEPVGRALPPASGRAKAATMNILLGPCSYQRIVRKVTRLCEAVTTHKAHAFTCLLGFHECDWWYALVWGKSVCVCVCVPNAAVLIP